MDGPPGSYDICPICGWEDDHVQLAYPTTPVGANGQSLLDWQQQVLREFPVEERTFAGNHRSPQWRPIEPSDLSAATATLEPNDASGYFRAAGLDDPVPYWQQRPCREIEAILAEVDRRAPTAATLRLWVPAAVSLNGLPTVAPVAEAIIDERLLTFGMERKGHESHPGGRILEYRRHGK